MDIIVDVLNTDVPVSITEDTIAIGLDESVIDVSLDGAVVCLPAGANWIDELYDVDTSTTPPSDGQTLVWNAAISQWVPGGVTSDGSVKKVYDCDGMLVIGDFVYMSPVTQDYVLRAIDNNSPNPVIGIVTGLPSPTTVEVTLYGFFGITGPIPFGDKFFVSETGGISITPPDTNYIQCLGIVLNDSEIIFSPSMMRIKNIEI